MSRFPLSLHHLTAMDASAAELVAIAEDLRCDTVCLFTYLPERLKPLLPCIETDAEVKELARRLADTHVSVCNLELFPIARDMDLDGYRRGFERGAALGGWRATTMVYDVEGPLASELFVRLCDVAAEYGIEIGLEFIGLSPVDSFAAAEAFLAETGAANASIVVDALHLFRTGGTVAELGLSDRIGYAQLCDGPLRMPEGGYRKDAIANRALPGAGEFPLVDMVMQLPAGIPVSVEVPQHRLRDQGMPAADRARRAVEASRGILALAAARQAAQGG